MNEILAAFDQILAAIDNALRHGAAVSIFLGLIVAIMGTQYLKRRTPFPPSWRALRKWIIRMGSLPLGFVPVFYTWPIPATRVWFALAVGLSAPAVYKLATLALYRRWPELEKKLSADPDLDSDETEGGVGR